MAGSMMAVFCIVALCSLVEFYQHFRSSCCIHLQGDDHPDDENGTATQKTAIFTAVFPAE
jgi:hypothetical protein